jgi:hypothetical protein
MTRSRDHVGAIDKRGRRKNPRNVELYQALHGGREPAGRLHDALADVRVTAASYAAGHKRRWW